MTLNWLFLDLNSYFASVEQAENPQLRNKPIAVVPMLADTTCCLAASYPAKAKGVKTGTSIRDAKSLCPGIIFVVANHRKYVTYHHKILEVVDTCIPISKVMSIDEMVCELMGREKLEENAIKIAHNIKQAIYTRISPALTCSIGIAPNSYLAKVASDMQKPDGLTVIHQQDIPEKFFSLTPRDFPGVGAKMEQRLVNARCLTVKKLYQMSISEMREVWGGIVGERFWWLIRGENLPEQATTRRTIGHSHVIAPQKRNFTDAWAICVQLLSKACMRLRQEDLLAQELNLSVKFLTNNQDNRYWQGRAKLSETEDTRLWIKALEKLWADLKSTCAKSKVLKVSVTLSKLTASTNSQLNLFNDQKGSALMQALDKVNEKHRVAKVYIAGAQLPEEKSGPGKLDAHKSKKSDNKTPNLGSPIAFQHIPKI